MIGWKKSEFSFIFIIVFGYLVLAIEAEDDSADEFFKSTKELAQLRGYKANDHFLRVTDGILVNIIEIQNPLLKKGYNEDKDPILFIHGVWSNANFFIYNSVNAKPKNYANFNAGNMSFSELYEMLSQDPASKSLPLLASNFGHSVWLLNRRGGHLLTKVERKASTSKSKADEGTFLSRLKVPFVGKLKERLVKQNKSKTIKSLVEVSGKFSKINKKRIENVASPRHWKWSLDDQANIDLPKIFDYILEKTNKEKLSVVGHSMGGAMVLMALIDNPELSNKISKCLLWSPGLYSISSSRADAAALIFGLPLWGYVGPFPMTLLSPFIQGLTGALCTNHFTLETICKGLLWASFGPGGDQQDLVADGGLNYFSTVLDSFGSHDLESAIQAVVQRKMRHFRYLNPLTNLKKYNSINPPIYDVTKINATNISIYSGVSDKLVSYKAIVNLVNDMKVPVEHYFINETGLIFNHISFTTHKNVTRLVNIPALKTLESN